jgi:hypothetical protein
MKAILERIKNEPALVVGLVSAIIALLLAFGLSLTDEQVGGIMAVVVAILAVVTRSQVTPTRVVAAEVKQGEVVTGPAAPPAGEPAAVVTSDDGTGLNEQGAFDTGILLAAACVVVIVVGLVWLFQAL